MAGTLNIFQCSRVQGASQTGGASDRDSQLLPQGSEVREAMAFCLLLWFSAALTEFLNVTVAGRRLPPPPIYKMSGYHTVTACSSGSERDHLIKSGNQHLSFPVTSLKCWDTRACAVKKILIHNTTPSSGEEFQQVSPSFCTSRNTLPPTPTSSHPAPGPDGAAARKHL